MGLHFFKSATTVTAALEFFVKSTRYSDERLLLPVLRRFGGSFVFC